MPEADRKKGRAPIILFTNVLYSQSPLPVHIFDLKGRVAKPGKLMARRNEKGMPTGV